MCTPKSLISNFKGNWEVGQLQMTPKRLPLHRRKIFIHQSAREYLALQREITVKENWVPDFLLKGIKILK
jgi:hypothetical protein